MGCYAQLFVSSVGVNRAGIVRIVGREGELGGSERVLTLVQVW